MRASPTTAAAAMNAVLVPPQKEYNAIWIAYALFGVGIFMWWPALLGLVVCYSKRNSPDGGFIASHHRWLIRSFWLSLAGYAASLAAIAVGLAPLVRDAIRSGAHRNDGHWEQGIDIAWSSLFATIGGASLGALGLIAVWLWFVYRVIRGIVRLSDAQPVP